MTEEIMAQIVSPEINGDCVKFRLRAPNANQVFVGGIPGHSSFPLVKGNDGVWTGEVDGLTPEVYSYFFEVDGARFADPSNRNVKKWLSCESMFEIRGCLLHEYNHSLEGELHHFSYESRSIGQRQNAVAYLPPGYGDLEDLSLLFLLHGYGDDFLAWIEVGRANLILDNLIAANRIRPLVVVMPFGHPLPIDREREFEEYCEKNGLLMRENLVNDLMPFIQNRYPVSTNPLRNAIAGLSMGGGQALDIGLKNSDLFSRWGGFSSAVPLGGFEALDEQYSDAVEHFRHKPQKHGLIWIGCGQQDYLHDRNAMFVDWLGRRGIEHQYHLTAGGHDWIVWRRFLAEFLEAAFPF